MFAVLKYWGRMSMIIFLGGEFTVRTSVLTKDVTNCCQLKSFGIAKALSDLVIHDFIPFEMHFEGFKYKEIAEQLDIPIGTVKSRIFVARKKLMELLPEFQN
jgi:hypothetical protein